MLQVTVKKRFMILLVVMILFSNSIFSSVILDNTEEGLIQVIERVIHKQIIDANNIETTNFVIKVIDQESSKPMVGVEIFIGSELIEVNNKKTNRQGTAEVKNVPIGINLLIQATRPGWQSFGKRYDIEQNMFTIVIELEKDLNQDQEDNVEAEKAKRIQQNIDNLDVAADIVEGFLENNEQR